jgi:hypothetical protein
LDLKVLNIQFFVLYCLEHLLCKPEDYTVKKRLEILLSLTKLFVAENNLIIPGQGEVCLVTSELGTGKLLTFFYSVWHCRIDLENIPFDVVDVADNDDMSEFIVLNVGCSQRHHQISVIIKDNNSTILFCLTYIECTKKRINKFIILIQEEHNCNWKKKHCQAVTKPKIYENMYKSLM